MSKTNNPVQFPKINSNTNLMLKEYNNSKDNYGNGVQYEQTHVTSQNTEQSEMHMKPKGLSKNKQQFNSSSDLKKVLDMSDQLKLGQPSQSVANNFNYNNGYQNEKKQKKKIFQKIKHHQSNQQFSTGQQVHDDFVLQSQFQVQDKTQQNQQFNDQQQPTMLKNLPMHILNSDKDINNNKKRAQRSRSTQKLNTIEKAKELSKYANLDYIENIAASKRMKELELNQQQNLSKSQQQQRNPQQKKNQINYSKIYKNNRSITQGSSVEQNQTKQLQIQQQKLSRFEPFKLNQISDQLNNSLQDLSITNFNSFLRKTNNVILNKDFIEYAQPSDNFKVRFVKQLPVKNSEMVYNVQQLLRMKKIYENQLQDLVIKPSDMIDYIKKRNKVDMIVENSKKMKNLSGMANMVEGEINKQNDRINSIINQLLSKFDVYKDQN